MDSKKIIYSGNIIFNSKKIRDDHIITQFKKLAKNNYVFQDMDILNLICKGKIKFLPPEFCLTTGISEANVYHKDSILNIWKQEELCKALEKPVGKGSLRLISATIVSNAYSIDSSTKLGPTWHWPHLAIASTGAHTQANYAT